MSEAFLPGEINAASRKLSKKERNQMLLQEVEALRAALDIDGGYNEETWGESAPQEVRDQFAASALIAEGLNQFKALKRLGFDLPPPPIGKDWHDRARRIFTTPGVKAILARDCAKFEGNLDSVRVALYNVIMDPMAPPQSKVSAAQQLGRMIEGWNDGERNKTPQMAVNFLMQLAGGASGATHNGSGEQQALPPGGDDVIDAEAFFAIDAADGVAVVDDSIEKRKALHS